MKKRLLAVFDVEESYTYHLIEYITLKLNNIFDVKGFTDKDELLRFCCKMQIDILLISASQVKYLDNEANINEIIILDHEDSVNNVYSYPTVNKYQSADYLMKEVIEYCHAEEETDMDYYLHESHRKFQIIGVYSPVNGCGKTSFALTLAYIYSKSYPTLYINVEEFSGLSKLLSKDFQSDMSDLFYFYKQSPNKLSSKLYSTVQSLYDIDIIPPMRYSYDLRNIKSDEWKDFIYRIVDCSDYEYIIIDLSNMVNDIIMLLEICSKLYMPVKNDILSKSKLNEFEEFLMNTNREDILNRTTKLNIPYDYLKQPETNYIENLFLSPFTNYVRDIIKEGIG